MVARKAATIAACPQINYLGMAIETVSRVLRQFKDMSAIVQKSMYRIHILDRDVLEMARGDI